MVILVYFLLFSWSNSLLSYLLNIMIFEYTFGLGAIYGSIQGSLLVIFGESYAMLGIKPGSAMCKANTLTLCLWPQIFSCHTNICIVILLHKNAHCFFCLHTDSTQTTLHIILYLRSCVDSLLVCFPLCPQRYLSFHPVCSPQCVVFLPICILLT